MRWWWGPLRTRPTRETTVRGRHVAPLGHIILIPSQPVFALSLYCYVFCGEAEHTNVIVFSLTQPELEPTIYRTQGEYANHYATYAFHKGGGDILQTSGTLALYFVIPHNCRISFITMSKTYVLRLLRFSSLWCMWH
jgi:hypothetical protein